MPCSDVSELLSLTVDHDDQVVHYRLTKVTCGAAVGNQSLLRKWIAGKATSEVLVSTLDDVLAVQPTVGDTWLYLTHKHLTAVQRGLRALAGLSDGGPTDTCAIQSIEADDRGITLLALVNVDVMTNEIKACGGCCGIG